MKQLLFGCLFMCSHAFGQVHQQGGAAVDLSIAKTGVGTMGSIAYLRNFADAAYLQLKGNGEVGRMYNFRYTHAGLDLMVFYNPFYLSDFFQFNAGAGLTLGYENVRGVSKEKSNGIGFMAGVKGGAQLEAFISDQLSFFLSANQAWLVKKSLGSSYYEVGVGIRIFLNNYY